MPSASGSHASPGSSRNGPPVEPKLASAVAACGIEMPVEHGDDGLQVVQDDARPSRRAEHKAKLAFAGSPRAKIDGRVHRASRALAGLDAVRHRTALVIDGDEGEIGELVVEQEAARHQMRAEGLLDGGGHGDRVAVVIDDGNMAGADILQRRVVAVSALACRSGACRRSTCPSARVGSMRARRWSR